MKLKYGPEDTLERHPKLSRWTETSTIFKNLFTLNLLFPTPRPSSTESSHKQCLPSLMLLDQTTELVLCKLLLHSPSETCTRRRPPRLQRLPKKLLLQPKKFFSYRML